jgi:hypothetical protein
VRTPSANGTEAQFDDDPAIAPHLGVFHLFHPRMLSKGRFETIGQFLIEHWEAFG